MHYSSKISHSATISASAKNSARHSWMRTEIYSSGGSRYCRFRWGKGADTWGYVHIAGGACTNELVQQRGRAVDEAIAEGRSVSEILALLRQWESAAVGRKRKKGKTAPHCNFDPG